MAFAVCNLMISFEVAAVQLLALPLQGRFGGVPTEGHADGRSLGVGAAAHRWSP